MKAERKVILYIAMSLDGYIAKLNDDISFLSMVEQEGEDYGYSAFTATVDAVILGRRTYDKVLSMGIDFPHADKDTYVITRTCQATVGSVKFYTGSIPNLVALLKSKPGKNIFVDGGALVANELLRYNLIDELYISIIPTLLGDGISLFKSGRPETQLKLVSAKSFDKGLVQLHYIHL